MTDFLKEHPHPSAMELTMNDIDRLPEPVRSEIKNKIVKLVHNAHEIGETEGYEKGLDAGKELGTETAYDNGYEDGHDEGYENGYRKGLETRK